MKKIITGLIIITSITLTGCINQSVKRDETKEYYYVFNITSDIYRDDLIDILDKSIDYNVDSMNVERPIPAANLPEKPGRFTVVDPFKGSTFGALAGSAAKTAVCDGKGLAFKGTGIKEVGQDTMSMTACLWEYNGGYSLDFYSKVVKGDKSLIDKLASSVVGSISFTPEEWAQAKAFDAIRALQEQGNVKVELKAGYPRVKGKPWETGDYKGKGLAG